MHAIVMAAPGYFGRGGPFPAQEGGWEHSNQSAQVYYRGLERLWRADEEAGVPPELVAEARAYAAPIGPGRAATHGCDNLTALAISKRQPSVGSGQHVWRGGRAGLRLAVKC